MGFVWVGMEARRDKIFKVNLKGAGGRASPRRRLMIGLLCPFRQLMWNRLLVARQGVLMTGRHMGRTKGAVHMGTPFITACSGSEYI